jgi:endoglucanase
LLDEVKWELEWMMKMQVPDGKPKAGMVHHKIHDVSWTALGIAPHDAEKKMPRFLRPPSTAATLNLAANGAQCGRVYKGVDDGLATRCLAAAEKAWAAAKANPAVYAVAADTNGGGPYDDKDVTDEFYWAAAELWVTTGKEEYKSYVLSSPHHGKLRMTAGNAQSSMTWGETDTLGKISMAVVPRGADAATLNKMRMQLADGADEYLKVLSGTGYSVPFKGEPDGKYPWGSNSFVVNNALIMALANDFTGQRKYFDGVIDAMGYVLGRNPLGQCYVTGYGQKPLQWPHHRFWSYQVDKRFPQAPPGCLSGGPNSGLQDPYVQAAGLKGCAPQKCFVDNIEAWSANEITINWNSPLAWVAAFIDERGRKLTAPSAAAKPAAAGKAAPITAKNAPANAPAKAPAKKKR